MTPFLTGYKIYQIPIGFQLDSNCTRKMARNFLLSSDQRSSIVSIQRTSNQSPDIRPPTEWSLILCAIYRMQRNDNNAKLFRPIKGMTTTDRSSFIYFSPSSVSAGRVVEDIHRISIFGSFVLRWRSLEVFRTLPCGRSRWPGQCFSAHNPLCLPEDHWLTLGSIGIVVPREMVPTGMLFWRHHPYAGSHNKLVFCWFGGQIAIAIKMH